MAQNLAEAHARAEQRRYKEVEKSGAGVKVYTKEELAAFQDAYNKRRKK